MTDDSTWNPATTRRLNVKSYVNRFLCNLTHYLRITSAGKIVALAIKLHRKPSAISVFAVGQY